MLDLPKDEPSDRCDRSGHADNGLHWRQLAVRPHHGLLGTSCHYSPCNHLVCLNFQVSILVCSELECSSASQAGAVRLVQLLLLSRCLEVCRSRVWSREGVNAGAEVCCNAAHVEAEF